MMSTPPPNKLPASRPSAPPPYELSHRDLRQLDLDHIEIDMLGPPVKLGRLGLVSLLASLGAILLWLPNTDFYQVHAQSGWMFFGVSAASLAVGLSLGRVLYVWAQEAAAEHAKRPRPPVLDAPPKPPSALQRWLVLGAAVGGAVVVVFMLPHEAEWQGNGYSGAWFLTVGIAIVTGILAGRWLMMQASVNTEAARDVKPIVLPPWTKWVTLGILIVLGSVTAFGSSLFATSDPEGLSFGLSAVGFVVGIGAAIWIARRFDEVEGELRAQTILERALGDDDRD